MGHLLEGKWVTDAKFPTNKKGEFLRADMLFRSFIGDENFPAEAGRYHLYISYACPWAHRTIIYRQLKGLENVISMSPVEPYMLEKGWSFAKTGEFADPLYACEHLSQIYVKADPNITAKVTVPVLWDKKLETIVNNESSEIIRMFNSSFNEVAQYPDVDFYPQDKHAAIDAWNDEIYPNINNGVYRCGFAVSQKAYDEAFANLFSHLDKIEKHLQQSEFLVGDTITEADWRLFTTLVRFDSVYVGHFKCNQRQIMQYPNLWRYLRRLYNYKDVAKTVKMTQIKQHYYGSHSHINPTGIIPQGPDINFTI